MTVVIPPQTTPVVTALPSNAIIGQQIAYRANATTGAYWNFVYDGVGSYPWKFIGGSPLRYEGGYDRWWGSWAAVSSTTQVNTGVSLTVPLAGDYEFSANTSVYNAAGYSLAAVSISRASTPINWNYSHAIAYAHATHHGATPFAKVTHTSMTASETVNLTVAVSDASYPCYFYNFNLWATPVRVG